MSTTRDWTPNQARYNRRGQVVTTTRPDTPGAPGLPQHFVATRHGVVARTWAAPDFVEIHLRRPGNHGATFQGTVRAVDGGWAGYAPTGDQVTAVHRNYLDAEAPLLPRRTNWRTSITFAWPRELVAAASTLDA